MSKRIEIFCTGKHIASNGAELTFSEADLQATIAAYDPALHEAPIVIGHPTHDAPAYGWVRSLASDGGRMQAEPHQVDAEFAEIVTAGRYKKISASFYSPTSPNNPKPGVYYLRHVGFLGAMPPAVKGLREASFSDTDESVTFEFGDTSDRLVSRALRSLRDFLLSKFGQEDADKALPSWMVDAAQEEAAQPNDGPRYSELSPDQAQRLQELGEREQRLTARETQIAERERTQRVASHREFAESLIKDGRPLPCSVDVAVGLMCALEGDGVSFGETETRSPLEVFQTDLLARLPKRVQFNEHAPPSNQPPEVDDPEVVAQRIVEYQDAARARGENITTVEAARRVRAAEGQSQS